MNNKSQLDIPIIGFAFVVIALMIFAPITLKTFNAIQDNVGPALANVTDGGAVAKTNFDTVMTPLTTWWDKVLTAAFVVSLIILFLSAFLIDTHPFWVIIYILAAMFLMIFTDGALTAVAQIYDNALFVDEVVQLSFMDGLRQNWPIVLTGIIVITGIIIYGKIRFFPSGGGSQR